MKKQYESPFFDITKIRLTGEILGPSQGSGEGAGEDKEETPEGDGSDFFG